MGLSTKNLKQKLRNGATTALFRSFISLCCHSNSLPLQILQFQFPALPGYSFVSSIVTLHFYLENNSVCLDFAMS